MGGQAEVWRWYQHQIRSRTPKPGTVLQKERRLPEEVVKAYEEMDSLLKDLRPGPDEEPPASCRSLAEIMSRHDRQHLQLHEPGLQSGPSPSGGGGATSMAKTGSWKQIRRLSSTKSQAHRPTDEKSETRRMRFPPLQIRSSTNSAKSSTMQYILVHCAKKERRWASSTWAGTGKTFHQESGWHDRQFAGIGPDEDVLRQVVPNQPDVFAFEDMNSTTKFGESDDNPEPLPLFGIHPGFQSCDGRKPRPRRSRYTFFKFVWSFPR